MYHLPKGQTARKPACRGDQQQDTCPSPRCQTIGLALPKGQAQLRGAREQRLRRYQWVGQARWGQCLWVADVSCSQQSKHAHTFYAMCPGIHELEGGSRRNRRHGKLGAPIRLHGKQRRWATTVLCHVSREGLSNGSKFVDAEGAAGKLGPEFSMISRFVMLTRS